MKDNIVLLLSTGLGNILNGMILYKTLSQKYNVDVFIREPFKGISKLFKGNIYGYTSYPPNLTKRYLGKVETLWGKDSRVRLPLLNKVTGKVNVFDVYNERISEVESNVRIAKELGINNIIYDLDLNYTEEEHFDIVLANTAKDFKEWGWKRYPYYKELAQLLRNKYTICSIGSRQEYIEGTVNRTGMPIERTAGIIKASNLVVTNDSGIYHLANALKVKNLVILVGSVFSKIYDKRFHRYSEFIYKKLNNGKRHIVDDPSLREIPPIVVAKRVETMVGVRRNTMVKKAKVLVAMPSNNQERLDKTLKSIFNAKNEQDFDVFVLDDGSNPPLRTSYPIFLERRNQSANGHFGQVKTDLLDRVIKLDYDYYYFTDDDYFYMDGWLDKALSMFKYPNVGISTVFCHPRDWEAHKNTTEGEHYFPQSTMGGSICIAKEDLIKIYNKYKDMLRARKGMWDYYLTHSIFEFGKKVISTTYSMVQHNPWEIPGYYKREQLKGRDFRGGIEMGDKVSIIILCKNQIAFTKRCIESIRKCTRVPYQIIVMDNNSTDGTDRYLAKALRDGDIYVRDKTPFNFSYFNNKGAHLADGKYIFIMNNDVEVMEDNWLKKMIIQKGDCAAIGTSMCYDALNEKKKEIYYNGKRKTKWPYLEGWGILIEKKLFLDMGGFDGDTFAPLYAEDADLSFRLLRMGKKIKEAKIRVVHYHNQTTKGTKLRDYCNLNAKKLYLKHFDRKYQFDKIYTLLKKKANVRFYTPKEDLDFLLNLVYTLGAGEKIVEIGTAYGETAFAMALLKPQNNVVSIDTYKSKEVNWKDYHLNFRRAMILKLNNLILIQKSSQEFIREFKDNVGFLWIDGDHSYEAVKKDIELWGDKLLPNHIICGHDYGGNEPGVNKAVEELVINSRRYKEFTISPNKHIWVARRI